MPLVMSPSRELAQQLGEAVSEDVECWDAREAGDGACRMRVTKDGRDFVVVIREAENVEG